jgi:hypothetical protein
LKADGLLDEPAGALRDRKIAVKLGVQVRELEEVCRRLQEVGLIDAELNPLAWDSLQYRSDTSAERVRKYRQKQKVSGAKRNSNVTVTGQDTDTDADTEITAKAVSNASAFPMLDCTDPATWADFLKNRKAKRLPNTASAHRKLETDLAGMVARTGWPPGQVFAACVAKGWGAIYDPRDRDDGNGKQANRQTGGGGDRRSSLARAIDEGIEFLGGSA